MKLQDLIKIPLLRTFSGMIEILNIYFKNAVSKIAPRSIPLEMLLRGNSQTSIRMGKEVIF